MRFTVALTRAAVRDLEETHDFVSDSDSRTKADHLIDRLEKTLQSLSTHPDLSAQPAQLRSLGIDEYRQVFFKPYRMIYRIIERRVVVYLIADGRRDMQSLLARRLFDS